MINKKTGKNRIGYTVIAVAVASAIGLGSWVASTSASKEVVEETEGSKVSVASATDTDIQVVPGESEDANFNKAIEEANQKKYEDSKGKSQAYVPTLVNNKVEEVFVEPPKEEPKPVVEEKKEEVKPVEEFKPAPPPAPIVKPNPTVQYEPYIEEPQVQQEVVDSVLKNKYMQELSSILELKKDKKDTEFLNEREFSYKGTKLENSGRNMEGRAESSYSEGGKGSYKEGPVEVRMGTIVPGVMLTAVNTDEPGPVMAEIVSGPLKGSRLIGSVVNAPTDITSNVSKATIQFTKLQRKGMDGRAVDISVFAVDPETSRTAVATDVDHHIFRNYGLTVAAAFVEGLGEAFGNMGRTVSYTDQATITQVSDKSKNAVWSATGKVGSRLGRQLDKLSNAPTTVKVDAGTTIGLLFMSDF